jgi:hypothetical protein
MKVIAFHGIHTASGDAVVPRLFPFLAPQPVIYPDYGWIAAVESRRINPVIAGAVRPFIDKDDILVGHSNGCSVIDELLQAGVDCQGVIYINGALTTTFLLPKSVKFAHVYWNPGDDYTILAMIGAAEGLVALDWGELGHSGYKGSDPRVTLNVNCGAPTDPALPVVDGHSNIFCPDKIAAWGPVIGKNLKGALNAS